MNMGIGFFLTNIMLGIGLAMDAFSVSLANGLNEPCMKKGRMCVIAGVFAFFQALMPMLGWICVHTIVQCFNSFSRLVPWIALLLLCYVGGKMLYDGIKNEEENPCEKQGLGITVLLVQGIATSIDALSVGFTTAYYNLVTALIAALVIALVTFIICFWGIFIGKKAGTKMSGKASILGGGILIFIGLEIFITGLL